MTEAQREKHRSYERKANMSQERYQRKLEYNRLRYANFSPDERMKALEAMRSNPKSRWANMSPEQRRAKLDRDNATRRLRPANHRATHLQRNYGLTEEDYALMLAGQGGGCSICGVPPNGKHLVVDHDHITGKVRALLCAPCNATLGNMKDSPSLLRAAADYIERHK
jgi:hypothetical protein